MIACGLKTDSFCNWQVSVWEQDIPETYDYRHSDNLFNPDEVQQTGETV